MKSTAREWDEVRSAFGASIMVDTALTSLAQSLDGPEWPIAGKDETPAKYIDLSFDEVVALMRNKAQPPERLDDLIVILRETLGFDTPFGDMVAQTETTTPRDNPILRNLAKLGIPENFSIELTSLGPDALDFCKLEQLSTLGEFAMASQGMSQNVIVGGDFRRLLNALSHVDENALAETLPFRRGQKGLHLVEAVAHAARRPDGPARTQLAVTWFQEERGQMEKALAAGGSLDRFFIVLGDPGLELKAVALLRPHLRGTAPVKPKRRGWFSWFSNRG